MSNAHIGWLNWFKSGTITAGSANPAMPPSKLADDQCSTDAAWQTANGVTTKSSGAWVKCAFGAARECRIAGIFRTNLTPGATVSFKFYNNPSTLLQTITQSGPLIGYGQVVVVLAAPRTADYLVIEIDDSGNPDGFVNIPGAFVGPSWQTDVGPAWDSTFGDDARIDERVSSGGQQFPDLKWFRRRYELRLAGITEAEQIAQLGYLRAYCRLGSNVLVVPDSAHAFMQADAIFGILKPTADLSFPNTTRERALWAGRVEERL